MVPENRIYNKTSAFFWNNQSAPQKLERLIVTQVNHKLLFAALSTLMINLFFQENSEPT